MELKRLLELTKDYEPDQLLNPDDFSFCDRIYLLKTPYNIVGLVFADCLQDAIDQAVDSGKMEYFEVDPSEFEEDHIAWLGNNGKPHIIDDLFAEELM